MTESDAAKALEIGYKAVYEKDYSKAIKFIEKSIRIFPTDQAQALLLQCRHEIRKKSADKSVPAEKEENKNSEEYKICESILGKKDYYDILGVGKDASEEEIKSKYKKLALKLHPDKNHCSKATEAFKKVSTACNCLTNKEKRSIYDVHGNEEQYQQTFSRTFEDEMTPEDLFNYFFFGAEPNRRMARRPREHVQRAQNGKSLLQFLPFLIMIVIVMVMNFSQTNYQSYYSLTESYYFTIQAKTANGIRFYVNDKYSKLTARDKQHVMEDVESTYINYVYQKCETAKIKMRRLRMYMDNSNDRDKKIYADQYDYIASNEYTSCKELEKYTSSYY